MEENKVKLFFINLSLQDKREFLNSKIEVHKRVQKDYPKDSIVFKACQEKIDKKQAEIAALE